MRVKSKKPICVRIIIYLYACNWISSMKLARKYLTIIIGEPANALILLCQFSWDYLLMLMLILWVQAMMLHVCGIQSDMISGIKMVCILRYLKFKWLRRILNGFVGEVSRNCNSECSEIQSSIQHCVPVRRCHIAFCITYLSIY